MSDTVDLDARLRSGADTDAPAFPLGSSDGLDSYTRADGLDRESRAELTRQELAIAKKYYAIGQTIRWNNPDSGNYGTITPTRSGTDNGGRVCREYSQTIYVGGKQQSGYGTACQQSDGSWKVVN